MVYPTLELQQHLSGGKVKSLIARKQLSLNFYTNLLVSSSGSEVLIRLRHGR